jgi:D-xylose 1-dehydrogenase
LDAALKIATKILMKRNDIYATYPSLRDRTVIITGGASGIGEAMVMAFASQGAQVAFLDIQDDAAAGVIERCKECGAATPHYYSCDLTNISAVRAAVDQILRKSGTIDVLVNNGGNDTRHSTAEVSSELWDQIIAVNLKHQFFMTQAVIPAMQRAQRGSIINMSSIAWVIPSTQLPVYVTAKAAIVGMTRTLAHELGGFNIRVNAVMPGAILTERQQRLWFSEAYKAEILSNQALKRMLLPEEVARLVLFLSADDSAAITNQSYIIDGGWV